MPTEFTPLTSFTGGLLIGLAAVLLMLFHGRIFGATGILSGVIAPANSEDFKWRASLLLGMITAPAVFFLVTGAPVVVEVATSPTLLVFGGILVGIGVTYGGGCTSGHGVCGMARLSPRSLVATVTFMATAVATVWVLRHVIGG